MWNAITGTDNIALKARGPTCSLLFPFEPEETTLYHRHQALCLTPSLQAINQHPVLVDPRSSTGILPKNNLIGSTAMNRNDIQNSMSKVSFGYGRLMPVCNRPVHVQRPLCEQAIIAGPPSPSVHYIPSRCETTLTSNPTTTAGAMASPTLFLNKMNCEPPFRKW